jgi:hypothetical protein
VPLAQPLIVHVAPFAQTMLQAPPSQLEISQVDPALQVIEQPAPAQLSMTQ